MNATMERRALMGGALVALGVTGYSIGGDTYEDIFFPEGVTPPSKEAFETELAQQLPPPITVSRLRFKLELAERGLLPVVDGTIATLPGADGDTARLYWAEATEFESDHALVLSIGALLDPPLSPSEIRVMFEAARDRAA